MVLTPPQFALDRSRCTSAGIVESAFKLNPKSGWEGPGTDMAAAPIECAMRERERFAPAGALGSNWMGAVAFRWCSARVGAVIAGGNALDEPTAAAP